MNDRVFDYVPQFELPPAQVLSNLIDACLARGVSDIMLSAEPSGGAISIRRNECIEKIASLSKSSALSLITTLGAKVDWFTDTQLQHGESALRIRLRNQGSQSQYDYRATIRLPGIPRRLSA
jgi:type II secretory ATPase GspE/PulE/Tfp pilus assembly ATPase PilB-like protein